MVSLNRILLGGFALAFYTLVLMDTESWPKSFVLMYGWIFGVALLQDVSVNMIAMLPRFSGTVSRPSLEKYKYHSFALVAHTISTLAALYILMNVTMPDPIVETAEKDDVVSTVDTLGTYTVMGTPENPFPLSAFLSFFHSAPPSPPPSPHVTTPTPVVPMESNTEEQSCPIFSVPFVYEGEDAYPNFVWHFYGLQVARWLCALLSSINEEERVEHSNGKKKRETRNTDHVLMKVHHCVTLALIMGSWALSFVRIGIVILLLHDVGDVVLSITQILHYRQKSGSKHWFAAELAFVLNIAVWIFTRLYALPRLLLHTIASKEALVYLLKDAPLVAPALVWMVAALITMHIYWLGIMLHIAFKIFVNGNDPNDAVKDCYECDDEDNADAITEEEEEANDANVNGEKDDDNSGQRQKKDEYKSDLRLFLEGKKTMIPIDDPDWRLAQEEAQEHEDSNNCCEKEDGSKSGDGDGDETIAVSLPDLLKSDSSGKSSSDSDVYEYEVHPSNRRQEIEFENERDQRVYMNEKEE